MWFVNLISKLDNKWGTIRPVQLEDPKYGLVVPVRAFGQFGFRIGNPRKFLEAITGTAKVFTAEQIVEYFKGVVLQAVNVSLGRAFVKEKISVLEAAVHLDALAKHCAEAIQTELAMFGVELVNFFFHSINIPDEDASYQRLKVIKEKAAELNVLGRDIYQYDRSMEVLKTAAANEGGWGGRGIAASRRRTCGGGRDRPADRATGRDVGDEIAGERHAAAGAAGAASAVQCSRERPIHGASSRGGAGTDDAGGGFRRGDTCLAPGHGGLAGGRHCAGVGGSVCTRYAATIADAAASAACGLSGNATIGMARL